MKKVSKKEFTNGVIWKLLERFLVRGISLIISVILAKILSPDDYGLIALTTVFTNLSEILIDAGFSTALIHKKEVDNDDYACVFAISCLISFILYTALFSIAPVVSLYYKRKELTIILRIMGLVLFVQAFASTRNAFINRNMYFKLLMKCGTISTVISGVIGIALAYFGCHVWSLVVQRLLQQAMLTLFLFLKIQWKPQFKFDRNRFKYLFNFSFGVIGASLLNYVENCVYSLIIGKHYSVADLGYYDKANILPEQISLNSIGAITSVLLPTVSSYQNNHDKLRCIMSKIISCTSFFLFPVMLGMLMTADEIILILFGEKWMFAAPIMKSISLYYISTALMLIDIQIFFGLGHSKLRMKTEFFRTIFIILGVIISCWVLDLKIQHFALINAVVVSLSTFITHFEVQRLIHYTFKDRLRDSYKAILSSVLMCGLLGVIDHLPPFIKIHAFAILIIKVLIGISSYICFSLFLKNSALYEILGILKKCFK